MQPAPAFPIIQCAICGKPVDRVTVTRDHYHKTRISVVCHGDIDEMVLTDEFLAEIGKEGSDAIMNGGGVAFGIKHIKLTSKRISSSWDEFVKSEEAVACGQKLRDRIDAEIDRILLGEDEDDADS